MRVEFILRFFITTVLSSTTFAMDKSRPHIEAGE